MRTLSEILSESLSLLCLEEESKGMLGKSET